MQTNPLKEVKNLKAAAKLLVSIQGDPQQAFRKQQTNLKNRRRKR